jgi:hypothetical protein
LQVGIRSQGEALLIGPVEPLNIAAMCDDGRTCAGEPLVERPHYRLLGIGSRTRVPAREAGHPCVRTENENLRGDRRIPLKSYVQLLVAT